MISLGSWQTVALGPKESRVCGSVEFDASVPFVADVEFVPEGKIEGDGRFDAVDEDADGNQADELDPDGELEPEDGFEPVSEIDMAEEVVEPEGEDPLPVPLVAFPKPLGLPKPPKSPFPSRAGS